MTMPNDKKYWAFLSYSHLDSKVCVWLHQALESFAVPKRLIGREGRDGLLPARLFPVFRDRDELPGSAELGANLTNALSGSRYLIVLCSPASARSRWVNEEIRLFKSMGGENRVLALIVDGEPNASDRPESGLLECFPEMLRYRVNAAGERTDERVEPIAADIRKGNESRQVALLRLVAGLLGVPFDELKQRDKERGRRQFLLRVSTGAAVVALLAGGLTWQYRVDRVNRLEDLGREALMKNQPTQAAVYLAEAYRMGRETPELRVMLDQAMRSVDMLVTVHTPLEQDKRFTSVAYSSDSTRLIAATESGKVHIWRADNGRRLVSITPPMPKDAKSGPLQARFLEGGRAFAVIGSEAFSMHQSRDGERVGEVRFPAEFSPLPPEEQPPAGNQVFLASKEGDIRAFDLVAGTLASRAVRECKQLRLINDSVVCANAKLLSTAPASASETPKQSRLDADVVHLAPLAQSNSALVTLSNGSVYQFDLRIGQLRTEVRHPGGAEVATSARRGDVFATGGTTGSVLLWGKEDGRLRLQLPAHTGRVRHLSFLADDQRLVTVGEDSIVKVWDTKTGALLSVNDAGQGAGILSLISPRWQQLATLTPAQKGVLKVWDLAVAGPLDAKPTGLPDLPVAIAGRGDTARCAGRVRRTLNADGSLTVIDVASGAERTRLIGGLDTVEAELDCDKSMEWLVTGGRSGAAVLWSAVTGKPVGRFSGHVQNIAQVQFVKPGEFSTTARDGSQARWAFEPEARPAATITRRVACRVPFELVGYALRPRTPDGNDCRPFGS